MKTIKTFFKNTFLKKVLVVLLLVAGLTSCSKNETTPTPIQQQNPELEPEPEPVLSSDKQMISFRFTGLENNGVTIDIPGEIDEQAKAIAIEMPSGTEITVLEPEVEIPDKAIYEPTGPQDFSTPINYTVTAEDGTSRTYLVTMNVALSQKEILLNISEANPGNTLNWNETDNLSDWTEVFLDGVGNITGLALDERQITILPAEIGLLGSLISLSLSFNSLSNLPPEIGQLNSLRRLNLLSNDIGSLPPEIGQLGSLEIMLLGSNYLSSLPTEIGQLSSLEILDLSVNNLSSLPPEIGQLGILERLGLSSNNLVNLPPEIGQLGSLETLVLEENDLGSLPPEIGQLGSLEILDLKNNSLSSLPAEIGQLGSLEYLRLVVNDLSSLPTEITQLVNLITLDLRNNNLSEFNHVPFIPSGGNTNVLNCSTETNLEELSLSGNPDLEVLNQCICDLDLDKGGTVDIDVVPNGVRCVGNDVIGD